jgi:hypothetical protein
LLQRCDRILRLVVVEFAKNDVCGREQKQGDCADGASHNDQHGAQAMKFILCAHSDFL